jgi:hypothetical protein
VFAPISYVSPQKAPNIHAIYHQLILASGKWAEGSDKSAPMIGNRAQGSDKKEFLRPVPLLERKLQSNGWKSVVHLFH